MSNLQLVQLQKKKKKKYYIVYWFSFDQFDQFSFIFVCFNFNSLNWLDSVISICIIFNLLYMYNWWHYSSVSPGDTLLINLLKWRLQTGARALNDNFVWNSIQHSRFSSYNLVGLLFFLDLRLELWFSNLSGNE